MIEMWAAFLDSMQEVGGRKIVIALLVLAFGVGLLFNRPVRFDRLSGVEVIYQGNLSMGPWPFAVPQLMGQVTLAAGIIWLMLMIFAGSPQFIALLEAGWRELTFSKGTPRSQIFLARFFSLLMLYYALTLVTCLPLGVRLWWSTGVSTLNILGSAMIQTFAFSALLAVGALASMAVEGGVAGAISAPFGAFVLSQFLYDRERILYDYVTSDLGRLFLDWVYYALPKITELQNAGAAFVRSSTLPTSWPLWTTGLFTATMLVVGMWILERKSF